MSGASTPQNSVVAARLAAVNECLHGGYVNYSSSSGKTFKNVVGCVIYAALGGTLVGLPDLVVIPSCSNSAGGGTCTVTVENIGPGPVNNGTVVLQESLTTLSSGPNFFTAAANAECLPSLTSQNVANASAGVPDPTVPGQYDTTATSQCTGTFAPESTTTLVLSNTVGATGQAPGQVLYFSGVVNPNHTIVESNYNNNNSFSQTYVA